jgi:hypothetical protein
MNVSVQKRIAMVNLRARRQNVYIGHVGLPPGLRLSDTTKRTCESRRTPAVIPAPDCHVQPTDAFDAPSAA